LVGLADGRYAVLDCDLIAAGSRSQLSEWVARRTRLPDLSPAERAWWQEVAGALNAPLPRGR
jgi:hypothetical protein